MVLTHGLHSSGSRSLAINMITGFPRRGGVTQSNSTYTVIYIELHRLVPVLEVNKGLIKQTPHIRLLVIEGYSFSYLTPTKLSFAFLFLEKKTKKVM